MRILFIGKALLGLCICYCQNVFGIDQDRLLTSANPNFSLSNQAIDAI